MEEERGEVKKRGRRLKDLASESKVETVQTKFFVDLSKEKEVLEKVISLLSKLNQKSYGREINFKDISLFGIDKITDKDFEKIRDASLSEMEKVQKLLDEHNQKNSTNLSMGEFLVKRLGIN